MIAALFNVALAMCPPGFRREYGASIRRDFARATDEERAGRGRAAAVLYALGATSDLFVTAFREYAAMLGRDLLFALRSLRKTPSFSAVVVLTLALAIGANAAVFSIVNAVVLAPLPYAHAERLDAVDALLNGGKFAFSLPDFADVVRRNPAIYSSAAAFYTNHVTLTGRGEPRRESDVVTTPLLFETLGARVRLGRFGTAADTVEGAPKVVVVSDALWRERLGGDPNVLGTILRIDGDAYRVVGVAPASFEQPSPQQGFTKADLWTFVPEDGLGTDFAQRGYHVYEAIARRRDGVSLAQANAAVAGTVTMLHRRYPEDDTQLTVEASSLDDALVGRVRPVLFALFAAVGAVLLVACANVASLLLSRAAGREREFSVRIAVGASRGRIVTQLLVEAFALAAVGGVLGVGLADLIVFAFGTFPLPNVPRADHVSVDLASILFTLAVVAFCTFAAGIVHGLTVATRDVATALKSAGRGGDGSRGARLRSALVASEIAVTLALVVAAGLVVRSYLTLTSQPLGFDARGVSIVGTVDLPGSNRTSQVQQAAEMDRLLGSVRAIPGVTAASWGFSLPFMHSSMATTVGIEGRRFSKGLEPDVSIGLIGTGFVRAMSATLVAGRDFSETDRRDTLPVAIVNEAFVRKFYQDGMAVGKRMTPELSFSPGKPPVRTIVGVLHDLRSNFATPPQPTVYVPTTQMIYPASYLVVRSTTGVGAAIDRAIATDEPLVARAQRVELATLLANDVAQQRLTVASLSALAFIALALSLAGVFAVMSYGVTQRTHEFGVRMALGADGRRIVRTVLGGAARLALAGVALGLVLAGAGTRLLADELYETQPLDPAVFGSVALLVVVAALVAALVPARRATRVDPVVALRYE